MRGLMEFQYVSLWDGLRTDPMCQPCDDVRVIVFKADYRAMKHGGQPFLTPNMTALKVEDATLCDFPLYEHGMFVVFETAALEAANRKDNAFRKKQMFVVFPTYLPNEDPPFVAGNHFTFCVNHDAKEHQRMQFHLTRYQAGVPQADGSVLQGDEPRTAHDKNNLPLRFPLAADLDAFKRHTLHRAVLKNDHYAKPLHALFVKGTVSAPQRGGAREKKTATTARRRADRSVQQRGARGRSFADLWKELPLHAMAVIGIRTAPRRYDVSVAVADRLQHGGRDAHVLRPCCRFTSGSMDEEVIQAMVAQEAAGAGWDWETFVIPPEDGQ
jgi:hypothetical protein